MFLDLQVVSGVALDDDLLLIWQSARSISKVDAMANEAAQLPAVLPIREAPGVSKLQRACV